ncbi:MAG: HD domain-containing protein, partial [Methanosarcinales archaeon]
MLAKLSPKNHQNYFQTLEGHSIDSLKILRVYLEKNQEVIMQFCRRWNIDTENFNRNLFITIYLHDIGKLTKQFQYN